MGLLYLHILAGLLGVAAGLVALFAPKGAYLHCKSGVVFSISMLTLAGSGVVVAIANFSDSAPINLLTSAIVSYMVLSSIVTVRLPPSPWIDTLTLGAALSIMVASFVLGVKAAAVGWELPTPMFFVFGGFALLAAVGDLLRLARIAHWTNRIARHLWRMGFALFLLTLGAFGQSNKVLPEVLRQRGLLAGLTVLVLVSVIYWFVRVLFRTRSKEASS